MKILIQQEHAESAETGKEFSVSSVTSWLHQQWLMVLID